MSYILDALRRADSERERGAVPSLHSKQVPAGLAEADDEDARSRSVQPLWWVVGALSLALTAVLAWLVLGRSTPEPERMVAVPVPMVAPPVAVQQQPMTPPEAPVVPAPPPAVQQAPVERKTALTANNSPAPLPAPARAVAVAKPARQPEKPVAPMTPPRDEEAPVPSISELPDDIRRQLPALSVSGASYSKNPASRMLILNGQVFKEGDKVANELVLEQIRLKSAVLSFRGRRYSVNF